MRAIRRFLAFIASRLFFVTLIVSLAILSFYTAMNVANIWILTDEGLEARARAVIQGTDTASLPNIIGNLKRDYEADILVIGNGTTSGEAQARIKNECPELQLEEVDEYYTTQLARGEYWKVKPPKGWRRLIPTSMQVPPEPVDDFVAVILARRFLEDHK